MDTNYDSDLTTAAAELSEHLDASGFPEGEREKTIADALNNTWSEGITIMEWVGAAERVITGHVPV